MRHKLGPRWHKNRDWFEKTDYFGSRTPLLIGLFYRSMRAQERWNCLMRFGCEVKAYKKSTGKAPWMLCSGVNFRQCFIQNIKSRGPIVLMTLAALLVG